MTILGEYGNKYYVETAKGNRGYLPKASVSVQPVIDWEGLKLDVLTLSDAEQDYMLSTVSADYQFTITWKLNAQLPSGYGYNVYLVPENAGNGVTIKLNDTPVKQDTLSVSAAKLSSLNASTAEQLFYQIRVDLVELSNESTIKLSAYSNGVYTIVHNQVMSDNLKALRSAVERAIAEHDSLYRGSYTLDGVTYEGSEISTASGVGTLYATIVGKLDDVKLDPFSRGALMADLVMKSAASGKTDFNLSMSELKTILGGIGFEFDIMLYVNEKDYNAAKKIWESRMETTWTFQLDREEEDRGFFIKYLDAAFEKQNTEQLKKAFGTAATAASVTDKVLNIVEDYLTYRNVKQEDVQKYIDAFKLMGIKYKENSLIMAATYLNVMTTDTSHLIQFIAASYGGTWAKDALLDLGYDSAIKGLPAEWQLAIKGSSLFNNLTMNVDNINAQAFELEAFVSMTEPARNELKQAYTAFEKAPTDESAFNTLREKYDLYIDLHKQEIEKLSEYCEAYNEAFLTKCKNLWTKLTGGKVQETTINAEQFIERLKADMQTQMDASYATGIAPLK